MYRRPYVESPVFIAFIRGESKGDDHNCKAVVDTILKAAEDGDFAIFTSSLTIAEVFKNKRQGTQLTEEENQDLRPYFRESYIRLIEVDRDIAERANELCRTHQPGPNRPALRPNDAIHLACAERADCEVLLAYDPDLTKQSHDSISIEWPQTTNRVILPREKLLEAGSSPIQEKLALTAGSDDAPDAKGPDGFKASGPPDLHETVPDQSKDSGSPLAESFQDIAIAPEPATATATQVPEESPPGRN